jgi:lipopolysaccharide transport system permease protein
MTTYLATVWQFRHFWMSLVRMDLRTRYRRSLLGVGWSLLQPIAMTAIFCVVFQQMLGASFSEFAPNVLSGMVLWNFVVACGVAGCQCFLIGEAYIRQCPLPLALYPLRTALGALFHVAMGLIVVTGFCAAIRGYPGIVPLLSLVPTLALIFAFGWALASLSGTFNVFFQDTQHLAEVGFQILFYLTPIIYTIDLVHEKWEAMAWLPEWNPVNAFLVLIREPLIFHRLPTIGQYGYATAITAIMAILAAVLLGRMQKRLIFYL